MQMHVARRLSEAIGSWLHFEFCCYRAGLFSENSLKAAVGSVLSSFPIQTKGARVHADFRHDALNPIQKGGRKREVDFALVLAGKGIPRRNAEVLVEAKWANSTHCNPENIFQDFLRLAILKVAEPGAACVFVLAGTHKSIGAALAQMPFRSTGKKNVGLSASGAEKKITLDHTNLDHKKWLGPAVREFIHSGFQVPAWFVTRSTGLHPLQSDQGTVDFQCIAWEVVSVSSQKANTSVW